MRRFLLGIALAMLLPSTAQAAFSPTSGTLWAQDQWHSAGQTTQSITVSGGTAPYTVSSANTSVVTASISGPNLTITFVAASATPVNVTVTDSASVQQVLSVSCYGAMSATTSGAIVTVSEVGYSGAFTAQASDGVHASLSPLGGGQFQIVPGGSDQSLWPNTVLISDDHGGVYGYYITTQVLQQAHLI